MDVGDVLVAGQRVADEDCVGLLGIELAVGLVGDVEGAEALSLPRRETPRVRVPMGSVCIAFRQAGVYSLDSPGGWHLLGRTPVRLFDTRRASAVLLSPGDKVRFDPVSRDIYERLAEEAAAGNLAIEAEGAPE